MAPPSAETESFGADAGPVRQGAVARGFFFHLGAHGGSAQGHRLHALGAQLRHGDLGGRQPVGRAERGPRPEDGIRFDNVSFRYPDAETEALTAYGIIGIKVWIFKGEILGHDPMATDRLMLDAQTTGVRPAREDRR